MRGKTPSEVYGGAVMSIERISKNPHLNQARTGWIKKPLEVSFKRGKYLYWVGGAPFFAAILPDIGQVSLDSARAAILLLNKLGIKPVILENERFSGHDLLWTGDRDGFLELAGLNIEAIMETGAETVIVSSPQDYHTLSKSYVEHVGNICFEVRHITDFIAERIDGLKFSPWRKRVTYHDPCWLGRGMGVYDAPRKILRSIPGVELVEMKNSRELSSCCGTSCWSNCTNYSKLMQVNRLEEAFRSGAEAIVTACWECEIHFFCTLRPQAWKEVSIEVEDLILRAGSLVL
jgi:Fe-S oxidoreductase